jgi:hypothetical protein
MPNLKSRLGGVDRIPSPDLWPEILDRQPRALGPALGPWGRLGTVAVAFALAATGIALAARAFLSDPTESTEMSSPLTVDPRVTATIPVGSFPANVAAGEGAIWVTASDPNPPEEWWVARIDPASNEVTDRIETSEGQDVAVGAGSVWVTGWERETGPVLLRIDPQSREVADRIDLSCCGQSANQVVAVDGAVWVTMFVDYPNSSEVVRIDPVTGEVIARIPVEGDARDLVVGGAGVWVYALTHFSQGEGVAGGTLYRIDPATNRLVDTLLAGEIPPASGVSSPPILAIGDGFVWVPIGAGNRIVRINSITGEVAEPAVHLDSYAWPFAVADGGLWLRGPSSEDVGAPISRVDTQTLVVDASLALEEGLAIDATYDAATDSLWLAGYRHAVTRIDLLPAGEPADSPEGTPSGPKTLAPRASDCDVDEQGDKLAETQVGQWLLQLLDGVGAPEGREVRPGQIAERFSAFYLELPEYSGRFEMNMFAEPPERPRVNADFSGSPVLARIGDYTVHGGWTGEEGFQNFVAVGPEVWISVHVIPMGDSISEGAMVTWFQDLLAEAQTVPPPACLSS